MSLYTIFIRDMPIYIGNHVFIQIIITDYIRINTRMLWRIYVDTISSIPQFLALLLRYVVNIWMNYLKDTFSLVFKYLLILTNSLLFFKQIMYTKISSIKLWPALQKFCIYSNISNIFLFVPQTFPHHLVSICFVHIFSFLHRPSIFHWTEHCRHSLKAFLHWIWYYLIYW